jgi:C1A family cysteine protease
MKFGTLTIRPRPFGHFFITALFVFLALFLILLNPWWHTAVFSQVVLLSPANWRAQVQMEFSPETLAREPELDQRLHKLFSSHTARQGAVYHLTRQDPTPGGGSFTLSLEGSGGLNQLKKMLSLAADPTILPGDGPMVLELSGPVRAGSSLPLTLEANPSTGFMWEITGIDPRMLWQRAEKALRAKSPLLGAPMTQTLFLEGRGDGESTVQITYRRPWLPDQTPAKKTKIQLPDLSLLADLDPPAPLAVSTVPDPVPAANPDLPVLNLAGSFDWRNNNGQNYLPPIRNQGSCGSCWAFGTVAPLEAAILIKQGQAVDLSEQYLVSCSFNESYDYGCSGGWFAHQYHQWKIPPGESAAGAVQETDVPYTGTDGVCSPPHAHPRKISDWSYVNPSNPYAVPGESAIKNAILNYGVVAAAVCVGPAFQVYRSGVFSTDEKSACGGGVNHAIALVGWDDADNTWIMRNSWGPSWGEGGYMRIKNNVSNIGYAANYVIYDPPQPARFTPTHWVYLPMIISRQDVCQEPLCNGGFEGGPNNAWVESSVKGWELILNLTGDYSSLGLFNHQGSYAAWLGGDYSETSLISQQITVPTWATNLEYWYWIDSADSCNFDFGYVEFAGTLLKKYDLCYTRDTGTWVKESINITAYRGQTGVLSFKVTTDSDPDLISNLFLDDIALVGGATQPSSLRNPPVGSPTPPTGTVRRKTDRGQR